MAKLTLLEIVQDILNDADSDPVNSINDTVESLQVAQIVKTSFFEMIASRNWPHLKRTIRLEDSVDAAKPTHLKLPVRVKELFTFNYNKRRIDEPNKDRYGPLIFLQPEDFLVRTNRRNSLEDNIVQVIDFGGVSILIRNDTPAQFYTSFDDEYIVADSWDSLLENTLHADQTQCLVYEEPLWSNDDSFIPDLTSEAFPALLAEAKSTAFIVLKQQANSKAEQKARRQQRWLSRKAWRVSGGVRYPNYGRVGKFVSINNNPLLDKDGTVNVS